MQQTLKQTLKDCHARAKFMADYTAHRGNLVDRHGNDLHTVFQGALEDGDTAQRDELEATKKMQELIVRARNHEKDAITELNELRMERVDLYVRATSSFASMMYENVDLKENEQAVLELSFRNPVNVRYIGQDGGLRTVKAVKARSQTFIDMREIGTDEVGYQMRDIQLGPDIAAQSQGTVDIAWDARNKEDVEAFNLLYGGTISGINYGAGVYGPFNQGLTELTQTYIPHPRIQLSNLPTTNDYANSALDDAGTSTDNGLFRLSVIRKILFYCTAWGNIFGDRPLMPTGAIFLPSKEALSIALGITPIGIVNNPIAEGILKDYSRFSYMGVNWTLIPDVTLPPGRCYPVLNRPVGRALRKTSMDQEFVESQPRKNWETRSAVMVRNWYLAEPWRPFALRIAYNNNPTALTSDE